MFRNIYKEWIIIKKSKGIINIKCKIVVIFKGKRVELKEQGKERRWFVFVGYFVFQVVWWVIKYLFEYYFLNYIYN